MSKTTRRGFLGFLAALPAVVMFVPRAIGRAFERRDYYEHPEPEPLPDWIAVDEHRICIEKAGCYAVTMSLSFSNAKWCMIDIAHEGEEVVSAISRGNERDASRVFMTGMACCEVDEELVFTTSTDNPDGFKRNPNYSAYAVLVD